MKNKQIWLLWMKIRKEGLPSRQNSGLILSLKIVQVMKNIFAK